MNCRGCGKPARDLDPLESHGRCAACWLRRVARWRRSPAPGQPADGPLARLVCLTLAGMVRQGELQRKGVTLGDADRLLLVCGDGISVYELAEALHLTSEAALNLVQANLDRGLLQLVPALPWAADGLAPSMLDADLAPALGGSASLPEPPALRPAPPASFSYPARSPVPTTPFVRGRFGRRGRR